MNIITNILNSDGPIQIFDFIFAGFVLDILEKFNTLIKKNFSKKNRFDDGFHKKN